MENGVLRESLTDTFAAVLSGKLTREAVERWAQALIDERESVVAPETWRDVDPDLWEAILYLSGCALRDLSRSDCGYLLSDENIAAEARTLR